MPISDHRRLTRSFFRGVNSTPLLRRLFEAFGVWTTMGLGDDAEASEIFEAWENLRCDHRADIEEALCRINDLSGEKARFALQMRALECGIEGYEDLSLEKLAMTLFLDHRDDFDAVYEFHTIEKTDSLHTLIGDSPVPCSPTPANLERFRVALGAALRREANGPQLLVEVARPHPEKWMAVIPQETYVKPDHEFSPADADKIITRDRHPIYEMILIYYPSKRVLKLKVGRGRTKVELVASCFATEILGQPPGFFRVHDVVSFEPLLKPGFSFDPGPKDHYESVRPTQIKFVRRAHPGIEYALRCEERFDDSVSVLDQLAADHIALSEIEIRRMSLCFQFPDGPRDTRTVEIGVPNISSLDETERDRYIERVLVRLGFIDYAGKRHMAGAGLPR